MGTGFGQGMLEEVILILAMVLQLMPVEIPMLPVIFKVLLLISVL
mgnify:CR=1 FL=1